MKNELVIFCLIIVLFFTNCNIDNSTKSDSKRNPNIAIIPYEKAKEWTFENGKSTKLSKVDMDKIDSLLSKSVDNYNLEMKIFVSDSNIQKPGNLLRLEDFTINLEKYKRQYVAIRNAKGEKEVWVNCFCNEPDPEFESNWKNELVITFDGGKCFFSLILNLTKEEQYGIMVNGEA